MQQKAVTVGVDRTKNEFQVYASGADGRMFVRPKLRRGEVLNLFSSLPPGPGRNGGLCVSTSLRPRPSTGEGWLYLAAVLDLATRKIVGWAMRDHMLTELPLAALMMAAQRQRPAPGLISHSDRGSQHAAGAYVDHLAAIGATSSMSRIGNCYDCEKARAVWGA